METPMNLAFFIPDWNSLDSVRNAHASLELWSIWLFAGLVVCDVIAHLIEDERKNAAKIFERVGLVLFAVAVIAELAAYKYGERNDELSEGVIRSLSVTASQAATDAHSALTDSGLALSQAKDALAKTDAAKASMDAAKDESGKARAASADALTLATGARKEADTFEADIKSAKKDAAEAKSLLAEAQQLAAAAESQIHRVTAPAYLVPVIHGVATPDLSAGFTQRILLTSDITINAPILPPNEKGETVNWTLLLDQDKKGGHRVVFSFTRDVTEISLGAKTRSTMEFLTESSGHTTLKAGVWSLPADDDPIKPPNAKTR